MKALACLCQTNVAGVAAEKVSGFRVQNKLIPDINKMSGYSDVLEGEPYDDNGFDGSCRYRD